MLSDQNISYRLICAVYEGRLERVRELIISFGLSYSQAWSEGFVLLCDTLACKHTEVAKLLLTKGSKVNSKNKTTDTPLHFAVINCNIGIDEMLLNRGANINAENQYSISPFTRQLKVRKWKLLN
jgi:ankyrin repeat protein